MRILIATTHVPFIRGGADEHAEGLRDALRTAGHETEIVNIPFKWYPPEKILDHMLACRLLDLTEVAGTRVDLLIGLKFPAYLIRHPNKVLWILHQHRTAYDLWDHPVLGDMILSPDGEQVRDAIRQADLQIIPEAKRIFALSGNVAKRLRNFCGLDSEPLYLPPPEAEKFYAAPAGDYFFFPSRLSKSKRQSLVIEALRLTREPVKMRFAGAADTPSYGVELKTLAAQSGVGECIAWLGSISEEEKRVQYAHSLGAVFPPVDEDYGFVTLEAMLAAKPVISCTDSGGPLEFIRAGETGLVCEPTPESLAAAMDELWKHRERAKLLGERGHARYRAMNITWEHTVGKLLA